MRNIIKISCFLSVICAMLIARPLFADEPHPQSHEAIKKMADELEAARKEREAGGAEKNDNKQQESTEPQAAGSGPITSAQLEKLKQQCDAAREKYLAPEKKAAIEECVANKVKTRAECETFYKDFGGSGVTQSGSFRQRRYHNIPECQAYYEAEKKQHMNVK